MSESLKTNKFNHCSKVKLQESNQEKVKEIISYKKEIEKDFNSFAYKKIIENKILPNIIDLLPFSKYQESLGSIILEESLNIDQLLKINYDNKEKKGQAIKDYFEIFEQELIKKKEILYNNIETFIQNDYHFRNISVNKDEIDDDFINWFKQNLKFKEQKNCFKIEVYEVSELASRIRQSLKEKYCCIIVKTTEKRTKNLKNNNYN